MIITEDKGYLRRGIRAIPMADNVAGRFVIRAVPVVEVKSGEDAQGAPVYERPAELNTGPAVDIEVPMGQIIDPETMIIGSEGMPAAALIFGATPRLLGMTSLDDSIADAMAAKVEKYLSANALV